jgi:ketopantoate reductase
MNLIQIFVPAMEGRDVHARQKYTAIRDVLIEKFGGLTEYDKAPASGFWEKNASEAVMHDQMIIYEVQCDELDTAWWRQFRLKLEQTFEQDEVLIRSQLIQIL